jgi:hypoxanthine-DNA glycosylase
VSRRRSVAGGSNAAVVPLSHREERDPGARGRNLGPGLRRGDAVRGDAARGDARRAGGARGDRAPSAGKAPARVLRGFAPIIDRRATTLILGSFPSEASLAAGQSYAHPRNQFWRLLGAVLEEPLAELDYAERAARVRAHRVGIWDVLDACRRPGSLDAQIRDPRPNDFAVLREMAPELHVVLFNGGAAGRFARQFAAAGLVTAVLPSSSPAHAGRSFEQKLALWHAAMRAGR